MNKTKSITAIFLFLIITFTFFTKNIFGQNAISFAISPPITEITIAPGKEFKQTYVVQNNSGDLILKPKIVYFNPSDNLGNVDLTENEAPDWVKYDKTEFKLKFEEQKTFNVIINPPDDIEETDHYLTLVFESQQPYDLLGQTSTFYKSEIGSNILITISKDGNPKKDAEIIEFRAPKVIDSFFGKIDYTIRVKNKGNGYSKIFGKINIQDVDSLKLAPLNILSGSEREISCIENETLNNCSLKKNFLIGNIVSILEFNFEDDSKIYQQKVNTIALPFSLISFIIILLTLYKIKWILKIWGRKK